jgi:hypothetical protein
MACNYCNNKSGKTDSRGLCISCGAPIDLEIKTHIQNNSNNHNNYNDYRNNAIIANVDNYSYNTYPSSLEYKEGHDYVKIVSMADFEVRVKSEGIEYRIPSRKMSEIPFSIINKVLIDYHNYFRTGLLEIKY